MKTEDLVVMLSANVEPADRGLLTRALGAAAGVGLIATTALMLVALGLRPSLTTTNALVALVLKVVFTAAIVGFALSYLTRLARPGGAQQASLFYIATPFMVIGTLAVASLAFAPVSHWDDMIFGDRWLECLLSIPIIAIVPFSLSIWAVRKAAPTDLRRTGAVVGLVSGGTSATAYAFHCTSDSFPFVTVWYSGTILLCTFAGAILGPRLLRW